MICKRYQSLKSESEVYSSHYFNSEMIIKKQRIPLKTFESFGTHKKIVNISTELL